MFFDHNGIKLEISGTFPNIWALNNTFINNPWIKEEITSKIRKCLNCIIKIQYITIYEVQLKQSLEEILFLHFIHLILNWVQRFLNDKLKYKQYILLTLF